LARLIGSACDHHPMKPRSVCKILVLTWQCLRNRLAGLLVSFLFSAVLWHVGTHEAAARAQTSMESVASFGAADRQPFQPMYLLPLLLSGLLLDIGRWRMRRRLNRARQQAFHQITLDRIEHQVRLVQDLLTLRRHAMQDHPLNEPSQRLLDELIVDHHRHLSNLHRNVDASDLMAPLLTGAYADDMKETTASALLQRELTDRNHKR